MASNTFFFYSSSSFSFIVIVRKNSQIAPVSLSHKFHLITMKKEKNVNEFRDRKKKFLQVARGESNNFHIKAWKEVKETLIRLDENIIWIETIIGIYNYYHNFSFLFSRLVNIYKKKVSCARIKLSFHSTHGALEMKTFLFLQDSFIEIISFLSLFFERNYGIMISYSSTSWFFIFLPSTL